MTDATEFDEAAVRARLEAATPGPWEAGERIVWSTSLDSSIDNTIVGDGPDGLGGFVDEADATFTAHARMDVVRLIEALTLQRHETSLVREARGEAMAEVEHWQTRAQAAEAQVERLHFDLDREARARQAAEGALAAVRADLKTLAFDMHRGWKHVASGADAAVLIDKFLDSHAALDTPTTTEGGEG